LEIALMVLSIVLSIVRIIVTLRRPAGALRRSNPVFMAIGGAALLLALFYGFHDMAGISVSFPGTASAASTPPRSIEPDLTHLAHLP
jgi:hypothetical protein